MFHVSLSYQVYTVGVLIPVLLFLGCTIRRRSNSYNIGNFTLLKFAAQERTAVLVAVMPSATGLSVCADRLGASQCMRFITCSKGHASIMKMARPTMSHESLCSQATNVAGFQCGGEWSGGRIQLSSGLCIPPILGSVADQWNTEYVGMNCI